MRHDRTHRQADPTAGFALPVAIFALVVVGLLVSGGFFIANQESRISHATHQGARALYMAEHAIGEIVDTWDNERFTQLPLFAADVVAGSANGGEWEVEVRRIGTQLYFLNSRAEITEGGQFAGANRTLGMVMRIRTIDLDVPAAVTTQGTVEMGGNASIDGNDEMPPTWGEVCSPFSEDMPGVSTTPGDGVNSSGNSTYDGSPPVQEDPTIDDDTFTQFGDLSWADLVALANHTLPGGILDQVNPVVVDGECDTSAPLNWGDAMDPTAPCGNYFPTIHIAGDAVTAGGGHGQGLLLVDGDLHMEGGFNYHGIIIVQGAVTMAGGGANAPIVRGGILSREQDPEGHEGASRVIYSTCAIQRALQGLNNQLVDLRPIVERTWVDLTSLPFS